jgi:hypothetical protein
MEDAEKRFRQLLGLMRLGCYLEGRDGHIWIEEWVPERDNDDLGDSGLAARLKAGGVMLNNKIYGGVLEALDTIDEALRRACHPPLAEVTAKDEGYGLFLPGYGGLY